MLYLQRASRNLNHFNDDSEQKRHVVLFHYILIHYLLWKLNWNKGLLGAARTWKQSKLSFSVFNGNLPLLCSCSIFERRLFFLFISVSSVKFFEAPVPGFGSEESALTWAVGGQLLIFWNWFEFWFRQWKVWDYVWLAFLSFVWWVGRKLFVSCLCEFWREFWLCPVGVCRNV